MGFSTGRFQKSFYQILNVPSSASQSDIKSAYFHLAKQLHPDQPSGNEAKFKEINQAYEVLGNEESRAKYDAGMHETQQQDYAPPQHEQYSNREWSQWSRTYYYSYDPFTGRKMHYSEDFQPRPPRGRRYARRPTPEPEFAKEWEEFSRRFNQMFQEKPLEPPGLNPYVKTAMVLFGVMWVWSMLEQVRSRNFDRAMYYERPYRP